MRTPLLPVAVVVAVSTGCVGFGARGQIGVTGDSGGRAGVYGLVSAGYGPIGSRNALWWNLGVEGNTTDGARLAGSVDGLRASRDDWSVRAGAYLRGPVGDRSRAPASAGFHSALLHPLGASLEDGLSVRRVKLLAGVETGAGAAIDDDVAIEMGIALTLEMFYRMDGLF